jgi:hypothetical protein
MIAPPRPPSHDDPEALIKEARERQLRRRLLGAAGVAIAAAIGLSAYALTNGNGKQASALGRTPIGAAPLCRSSQLSAVGGVNGASGMMLGPITLTNTGESPCSLPTGQPQVRIAWQGRVLRVRETGGQDLSGGTQARVLAPHSTAMVYTAWANWCGKPSEGTIIQPTFELRWVDGLGVDAPNNRLTPPRCGSRAAGSTIAVSGPVRD